MTFDIYALAAILTAIGVGLVGEAAFAVLGRQADARAVDDQRRWNRIEALVAEFDREAT